MILAAAFLTAWVCTAAVTTMGSPRWVIALTATVAAWTVIAVAERRYLAALLHRPTHRGTRGRMTVPAAWTTNSASHPTRR